MINSKEMISLDEAFKITDKVLSRIDLPRETVHIDNALGRTTVRDQVSLLDIPPFDKSAMDGYAVLADDERSEYRLLETVPAGGVPTIPLKPGTATKVMTGAAVPEGSGKVIMIEKTSESDGNIRILCPETEGNICLKGEDVRRGDVVLPAFSLLGPLEIANLISAGFTELKVARPLKVSILATGDEIVDSYDRLTPGRIMNSNGPMLAGLCRQHHLQVVDSSIVHDDPGATVQALREALEKADIVVLSGGVSVGDFDFVAAAMNELDLKIHFDRVAVKPGKPVTFATSPQKTLFGLPGNPVSVFLMFHLFVLRAAKLMLGRQPEVRHITLPLAGTFQRRNAKRLAYVPSRLTKDGALEQVAYHGSAHLQALLKSDGFFMVPEGVEKITESQKVTFMPIKGSL